MKTSGGFKIVAGILALLTLVGVGAWVYQLINGLAVTGMNNGSSWGLYIACFMFFVGLSAGGLIVASSASVFGVAQYKKVALPAVILSTVSICIAGMFVLIDMGGVQRIYQLLLSPNFMSPLFWDVCVITLYLIINVIYLYFMLSKKADQNKIAIVSRFALPTAILVHSVTAWIFGLQISQEGWYSAIMAPIFVASALDSGLALLILALTGLRKAKIFHTDTKLIASLAGLLVTCIAIDGFLVGCEILTVAYPQTAAGSALLGEMFTGATALFFWGEVLLGLLIPFVILIFARNRQKTGLVVLASVCVIVGVFFKRLWLLLTTFIHPNVFGAPGISSGSSAAANSTGVDMWAVTGMYSPTMIEILVTVGVISLGALAFMLLANRFLPGRQTAELTADTSADTMVDADAALTSAPAQRA